MKPIFYDLIIICLFAGAVVGAIARLAMGRSFVRWFVYGLLAWPIAAVHLAILGFVDKSGNAAPKVAAAMILAAGGFSAYTLATSKTGFTEADIEMAKNSIRQEFSKRDGVTVTDVVLLRDGPQKLSGFAKFKISGTEIMRNCSALMDETDGQFMWRCE